MTDFEAAREAMIERQLKARGIADERILAGFRAVPREAFVAPELADEAYGDHPLPIGLGQTISQPYIVALMIAAAEIGPDERVLEVGSGSGYAAAVVSRIAASVIGLERHAQLAAQSSERLDRLGFANVEIIACDGTAGWPAGAPYDAILVAAGGAEIPQALVAQLAAGGTLVMPVGGAGAVQQLVKLTKSAEGSIDCQSLGAVRFVPLIGS